MYIQEYHIESLAAAHSASAPIHGGFDGRPRERESKTRRVGTEAAREEEKWSRVLETWRESVPKRKIADIERQ